MTAMNKNLNGLILAGGHSTRMGQDKSLLVYHAKPQIEHVYDLLTPFCAKVFISKRLDQEFGLLPFIEDLPQFANIGPLGGILSAMTINPNQAWLILACDLPFVTEKTLEYLIKSRNLNQFATAFIGVESQLPEPLCAIWEPMLLSKATALLEQGIRCPRKILIKSDTHLIQQQDKNWLDNVNYPYEYQHVMKNMKE